MSLAEIVGFVLVMLVVLVSVVGSFLPSVPSTPLVFLAALCHWMYFREASADMWVMVTLFIAMILSLVVEQVASVMGARKLGASKYGTTGAVIGALVGMFFGIPGVLIGPFLGAVGFELLSGREVGESMKAGAGALIGVLAGSLGKIAFCLAMAGLWAVDVVWKVIE